MTSGAAAAVPQTKAIAAIVNAWRVIAARSYHFVIAVSKAKEVQSNRVKYWEVIADNFKERRLELGLRLSRRCERANDLDCRRASRQRKAFQLRLEEASWFSKAQVNRTTKCLPERRTREFQPCRFCFGIFLPATRSRTARRNFSRSAGLSMSSLRFIASATVLA